MPDEIVPQEETAEESVEVVESDTTEEENVDDESAEETPKSGEETTEETEAESTEPDDKGKTPKVVEELKQQRKMRQDLEVEVAMLRQQQAQSQQPSAAQAMPQVDPNEPKIESYESFEDYQRAFSKYQWDQMQNQFEKQKTEQKWSDNYRQAMTDIPDFDYVIRTAKIPLPNEVLDVIKSSDLGPQVAYYLAKNPQEAYKLHGLSALAAAKEIGKLELSIANSKKVIKKNSVSRAPEPIAPTAKSAGKTVKDPMDMSDEEFIRMADEREYGKSAF
jgi:hypothetical protein